MPIMHQNRSPSRNRGPTSNESEGRGQGLLIRGGMEGGLLLRGMEGSEGRRQGMERESRQSQGE